MRQRERMKEREGDERNGSETLRPRSKTIDKDIKKKTKPEGKRGIAKERALNTYSCLVV